MKTYTVLFDTGEYYNARLLSRDPKRAWMEYRHLQRLYESQWKRSIVLIHGYYKTFKYTNEKGAQWA